MSKKTKILIGVSAAVATIILIALAMGGGENPSYKAGYDRGYSDVMQEHSPSGDNLSIVNQSISMFESGAYHGRLSPRDDDPKYVAGYKAGMRAAAKEVDSR
ncbi:MAG: hypothetical protein R3C29_17820 [Dehalococcoidia bacterium]